MLSFLKRIFPNEPLKRRQPIVGDPCGIACYEDYVDDRGVVKQRLVFKTDYTPDPKLTVNDFCLQNLIAAGVKLKEVGTLDCGTLALADHASAVVEKSPVVEPSKPESNE